MVRINLEKLAKRQKSKCCHYSDLGNASDWMKQKFNQLEVLPRYGQIWLAACH